LSDYTYLNAVAVHVYNKLDIPSQTIAVLYTVQAIIDNGGFRYFFENDTPFKPPYSFISDAYRRIGMVEHADRLDKAVKKFPFNDPHLYQEKRLEFMESLKEEDEFFELGFQVCCDESVWVAMDEYAFKNALG
jgi:hypothetical protein